MTGEAEFSEYMNTERCRVQPFAQSLCVTRPTHVRFKLHAEASNLIDNEYNTVPKNGEDMKRWEASVLKGRRPVLFVLAE